MAGLKVQTVDSTVLKQFRFQNINDLLQFNTPIVFRNYGPGQLSTVSFRGTSSNHTAVLWNGVNINSPSLGQTDFSTIPVAAFDKLTVQYGSSASLLGSDAVGGSILLGSGTSSTGFYAYGGGQFDSFLNHQVQAGSGYGAKINEKWSFSGKTAFNYSGLINHFGYKERNKTPVLPSETFQKGLVQDLLFQSKKGDEISAHVWLADNELTLVPDDTAGRELTKTSAYRTMLEYRRKGFSARSAWVRDIIDYGRGNYNNLDHAVTDRFINGADYEYNQNISESIQLNMRGGATWTNYRARIEGYTEPLITENRADIFFLTRLAISSRVVFSANLRKAFITAYSPPLTPSFGADLTLLKYTDYTLKLRSSVARSFRSPTLNERYWKDLGNPDIRPESGWNKEVGLEDKYEISPNQILTTSLTAYHNRVKDWTYWNPAKNFRVENLQQVLAKGIEVQAGWSLRENDWKTGLSTFYSFTKTVQEKAYDNYSADIVGNQLPFVPFHNLGATADFQIAEMKVAIQTQFSSKRYTTFDNTTFLKSYGLVNVLVETTFVFNKINLLTRGQINNITNTFYQSVRSNAMPGRSFAISAVVSFRKS